MLCADAINVFAHEKHADCIDNGETSRDETIAVIIPSELWRDIIFPCERQNLTVHVVYHRGEK